MRLARVPIVSNQPVVMFAAARLALAVAGALAAVLIRYDGWQDTALTVTLVAGPWCGGILLLARRHPDQTLGPPIMAGDLLVLLLIEVVTPNAGGAVHSAALFLIAAHANFQGDPRGVIVAVVWSVTLAAGAFIRGDNGLDAPVLAFYETVFVFAAVFTGLVVGRLRTAESSSRLEARDLSRRAIRSEGEVRRRLAGALHDGPVQELIGLDMILVAAGQELERGNDGRVAELLFDARQISSRNVQLLRDEMVDLGPWGFQEAGFGAAIEQCVPIWARRYSLAFEVDVDQFRMAPEVAGELFRIAQEAVANAGRHAHASRVTITLRAAGSGVTLNVTDDGRGFPRPVAAEPRPGHLGMAGMRERANLLGGDLEIGSSPRGSSVTATVPRSLDTAPARP